MTELANSGTTTTAFNTAAAPPPGPTITQMLQQLGYNTGKNGANLSDAVAAFGTDHAGQSDDAKIRAVYQATEDLQKSLKGHAPGITLAQANGILVASEATHVPTDTIAKLAESQRVFDPGFTTHMGRKPGLIQMSDDAWLQQVKDSGANFPGTKDLAAQMNAPGPNGKPRTINQLPEDLKNDVLNLRSNPVVSAEIGSEYAKTHPVQLDTMRTWLNTTGKNASDAKKLDSLFASGGISNFDPRVTHGVTTTGPDGKPVVHQHETNPWCAAMANSVLNGAGVPESNGGSPEAAADFMNWGTKVDPRKGGKLKPGDIVMFKEADGQVHHVAFVSSVSGNTFTWVGGNQGNTGSTTLGEVTQSTQTLSVNNPNVLFREPPPNGFAQAEAAYQKAHPADPAAAPVAAAPASAANSTTRPAAAPAVAKPAAS